MIEQNIGQLVMGLIGSPKVSFMDHPRNMAIPGDHPENPPLGHLSGERNVNKPSTGEKTAKRLMF